MRGYDETGDLQILGLDVAQLVESGLGVRGRALADCAACPHEGVAVFLVYLWLPLYMFHQYQEHAEGTLLEWYERMMPGIAPFLTERKLLVVNLVVVWLGFLVALYAAFLVRPALGLAAPYLAFVNAFMHIGQFLRWRCYNPGLWTALAIFIPGAGYTISELSVAGATWADNALGLGIAVLAHSFFFALGRGMIGKQF